ncbi:MAG: DUF998 domain-containing protein [Bdellovibrionales bacterium]
MTVESAKTYRKALSTERRTNWFRRWLLRCGIAGAALYPLTDIFAATRYPGFSYRDQAVSELFAIGIWMSARGRRLVRMMAVMMALNTVDALVLWNFFPMHMRGSQPTFTDMMHGLLAVDPFLLAVVVLGVVEFRGWFRAYTIATIIFTSVLAVIGFSYISAVIANQPTPWMGASERASQYVMNVWYAVLALMLLSQQRITEGASS